MTAQPETQYAWTSDGYIGYQVFGTGDRDLIFIGNWASNVEVIWDEPIAARHLDRLGSFSRVLFFDKRGSGISDPVSLATPVTIESWMDDARAVADAVGSGPLVAVGDSEGGPMAMLFAATYPQRVSALVLVNTYARQLRAPDYRIGLPERVLDAVAESYRRFWGSGELIGETAPSLAADDRFKRWLGQYERLSMPPGAAATMFRWVQRFDVRSILGSIHAPTLVIQRRDSRLYRAAYGQYLADHIPGATYVELPGADTYPYFANSADVLAEIQQFVTGTRAPVHTDRQLATVLFTDIVDSTGHAVRLGDERWGDVLKAHQQMVRQQLGRFGGREIDTAGDGFLALFDGPTRAVMAALAITRASPELGLEVRAGVHTGEVELVGTNVSGIAVHIASRVLSTAGAGVVMTTSTVRDLAVGSGIEFLDRGSHELKGVPGNWQLLEVAG